LISQLIGDSIVVAISTSAQACIQIVFTKERLSLFAGELKIQIRMGRVTTLKNLRYSTPIELIRIPKSLTRIRLSLVPELPSTASPNLRAAQYCEGDRAGPCSVRIGAVSN
jgi:hypothetical protein